MAIRVPDLLAREIRYHFERFQDRVGRLGLRRWVNDSPRLIVGLAIVSALLLAAVLARSFKSAPSRSLPQAKTVWFYDMNTGKLFTAGSRQAGPIAAPSGPAAGGEPAGLRAHVYSYVLDPNEAELFTGFLERPDPDAGGGKLTADMRDVDKWARGRLIKRVKDKQWVQAGSPEGRAILRELVRPNKKGQTPVYQVPREP